MHDVFISYSSKETRKTEAVLNILEQNQIPCWMAPRDIPSGSNYAEVIPAAIRSCKVFVLILTKNAQNSPFVRKELDMAINYRKVIIPYMLEDFQLDDAFNFLLTDIQRVTAYNKNVAVMKELVERIHAITVKKPGGEQGGSQEGGLCCPFCGSNRLSQANKLDGARDNTEEKVENLIWVFPYLGLIPFLITFSPLLGLAGAVIGFLLAKKIVSKFKIRHRKQIGQNPYPLQCEQCRKLCYIAENEKMQNLS